MTDINAALAPKITLQRGPRIPPLDDHAFALGYVCIWYSQLVFKGCVLFDELTGLTGDQTRTITNHIDTRQLVSIVRALAFTNKPSPAWYDELNVFLLGWESTLISKRNRYVHDIWMPGEGGPTRVVQKTKIKKPQSWQEAQITTVDYVDCDANEIWDFVQEIQEISAGLSFAHFEYLAHLRGERPKSLPTHLVEKWRRPGKGTERGVPT